MAILLNELETSVLGFWERHSGYKLAQGIPTIELSGSREVQSRGYFTDLNPSDETRCVPSVERDVWSVLSGRFSDGVLVGFLVFAEENFVTGIEGFTYGEAWPGAAESFMLWVGDDPLSGDMQLVLNPETLRVTRTCLRAAVEGPIFPDWEFQTLFSVDRGTVRQVLEAWPLRTVAPQDFVAATMGSLRHLLGYPHGLWDDQKRHIAVEAQDVRSALDQLVAMGL